MLIKEEEEGKNNKYCPKWGSNSRPPDYSVYIYSDYETDALPTALLRPCMWCDVWYDAKSVLLEIYSMDLYIYIYILYRIIYY